MILLVHAINCICIIRQTFHAHHCVLQMIYFLLTGDINLFGNLHTCLNIQHQNWLYWKIYFVNNKQIKVFGFNDQAVVKMLVNVTAVR